MSTLSKRLAAFLRSPQGQKLVSRGRQELAKPRNQQRLRQLMARLTGRRH